jgi:uncharacterized protein YecT (DUF1311 family)
MRSFLAFVAIVGCAISCGFLMLAADEPGASENPSQPSPPATAQAEEKTEVLYTSPSGAFRIELSPAKVPATEERASGNVWLVSTKDPGARVRMPALEGISPVDDEYHSSSNDEWIFGVRKMAHGFSNGDLFHRIDPEHVELAPTKGDQSFNDRVWPFCVKQGALKANYSAEEGGADIGQTSFMAWSFDSGRLLVQLSGGHRHGTLQTCYVYFNTRTETFEMSDYLRKLNKTNAKMLPCAEPIDPLPSEADLKTRFEELDRQLNEKYKEVLAHAGKGAPLVREAQRTWIKHRDEGDKFYVSLFPAAAEKERRHLQFLCDVTAARIETQPEEAWEL